MTNLPDGWDTYDPNDHESSADPAYRAARRQAGVRAERRRAEWGAALTKIRKARALTQVQLAEQLGVAQGEVSRIEHQADVMTSTFARYIEAMGGHCVLHVHFADGQDPVEVDLDDIGLRLRQPHSTSS